MNTRKLVVPLLSGAAAAAVLVAVFAQQPLSKDLAYQKAAASKPGGTPEDRLWEVLVLMGVKDTQPAAWDGRLDVQAGDIFEVRGYRFSLPDRVLPQGGWRMTTKIERVFWDSPVGDFGPPPSESLLLPKGLFVRGSGTTATTVSVHTAQGACSFAPMTIGFESPQRCADGRIEVRRVPATTDLSGTELRQHDFPSIGASPDGRLWVAWLSYHDRREELNFRRYQDARWTRLIPVGRANEDLWRPQVATDAAGKPWLIWSEQENGNWDIYAMAWEDNEWGPRYRLSQDAAPDIEPDIARAPDGTIFVVWQSLSGGWSHIRLRYLKDGKWSPTVQVTSAQANDWAPAVAAGPGGRAWIAWDRYTTSYDVYCRSFIPGQGLSPERVVVATPRFEAYASVAVDRRGRPWIAWEVGGPNWGKDVGAALGPNPPGTPLGDPRHIEVLCLDAGMPAPVRFHDTLALGDKSDSCPLLFFDPDGNLWMSFKRRYSRYSTRPSTFWETYLTRLDGDHWTDPIVLPHSWTRKSTRMGLAASKGRLWAFWPSENRDYDFASRPEANRVIAGSLPLPGPGREPQLVPFAPQSSTEAPPLPGTEPRDIAAIRAYRTTLGQQTLRIVRGDLHRHTELSQDTGGVGDGTLPEFFRYMIDAAGMDFGADTDHQAGGTGYWFFMIQKMTDMYLFPHRFVTLHAYERNMGFPFGHRNIIYTKRDYRIVPFFQKMDPRFLLPDTPDGEILNQNSMFFGSAIRNDTQLLWEEVRKSGGLSIPHTSSSSTMGTDWKPKEPSFEPVAEIYQGARFSSEAKNVPRGIRDGEEKKASGGFQEAGLMWNAWKKGYRIGVIASSDHDSTHVSYAMVYTPAATRQAIFKSIAERHTYGATDNIILEFRLGDHLMGDDFTASEHQNIRVKAHGTGIIQTIRLIRDATYIYTWSPNQRDADFEYRDASVGPGDHWYYVRVEQQNGELAWSSPIWVRYR